MLQLEKISKSFPQRGTVLVNLNLFVKRGETVAITGPSGSGKTTLLNMIGLLDKPDSGSIQFEEQHITGYDAEQAASYRRKSIGFVFQDHLLMPHLTIIENIYLPILAQKRNNKNLQEIEKHVNSLMDRIGISNISKKYPHEISGGEAQRATLVRALINKPQLILADEPTGSLDSKNGQILGDLLNDINKEFSTTILAVTHSESFASKMSRKLNLEGGILL